MMLISSLVFSFDNRNLMTAVYFIQFSGNENAVHFQSLSARVNSIRLRPFSASCGNVKCNSPAMFYKPLSQHSQQYYSLPDAVTVKNCHIIFTEWKTEH